MSLKAKLTIFCLLVGLVPVALMGGYAVNLASESLKHKEFRALESLRDARKDALENLFERWREEALIYAGTKEMYNAMGLLRDAALGTAEGERIDLEDEEYAGAADWTAPAFDPFVKILGFEDVYLIGDHGRIFFTQNRGLDMGEDLVNGKLLKDTNLRRAFDRAVKGEVVFTDFAPYPALDNRPCAFIAAPLYDHVGVIDGVVALRLPLARINAIMTDMGSEAQDGDTSSGDHSDTEETFLVGSDGLMRSDARLDPEHRSVLASFAAPDHGRAQSASQAAGLEGKSGVWLSTDYRGKQVLCAYTPVTTNGFKWVLVAKRDATEAFATASYLQKAALVAGAATVVLVLVVSMLFIRRELLAPLGNIGRFLEMAASGDLNAELSGRFRAEMGELADGILKMVEEIKKRLGFAQGVLKGITYPCMVLNTQREISYANDQILELMEKRGRLDDWKGRTAGEFFFSEPEKRTISAKAMANEQRLATERELTTESGRKVQVSMTATPIYDLDGKLQGVITLYYDLTEIRENERRIREQNKVIARAADQATEIAAHVTQASHALGELVRSADEGARVQSERTAETASAMQQMNASMNEVAQSAMYAAESADGAKDHATGGKSLVDTAVDSIAELERHVGEQIRIMDELDARTEEVGKILGMIQDIADQTNLLALNAAIEAARAGDAGRGFAVVADEVRKLAEKTMEATSEVGAVITGIRDAAGKSVAATQAAGEAVSRSTSLAGESGQALVQIVELVDTTASQVGQIASASEEQAATNEAVNKAVEDIYRISSDTAANMARSSEAIGELAEQALRLERLIKDMNSLNDAEA